MTVIETEACDAVVVGAGPGGLATVTALLDAGLKGKIIWVDPTFNGGRLNELYREISSNTKTHIYLEAIGSSSTCQQIVSSASHPHAVDELKKRDPESTVQLALAGDMVMLLVNGLLNMDCVQGCKGKVTKAERRNSKWTVTLDDDNGNDNPRQIDTPRLFLCTGSQPISSDLHMSYDPEIQVLDLDRCMIQSTLPQLFDDNDDDDGNDDSRRDGERVVSVIGNSHSGILVCRNLYEINQDRKLSSNVKLKIVNFHRREIKYAEYRKDGIVFDNTGLKGDTADWARKHMSEIKQVQLVPGKEEDIYNEYLREGKCDYIIYAIGYEKSSYPPLYLDDDHDEKRIDQEMEFDHSTSGFTVTNTNTKTNDRKGEEEGGNRQKIPGLWGIGIAHPEMTKDPKGHVEAAVGLAKFFKFAHRVKDDWVREDQE